MEVKLSPRELAFVLHKIGGQSTISTIKPNADFSAVETLALIRRLEAARLIESMQLLTPAEARELLNMPELEAL